MYKKLLIILILILMLLNSGVVFNGALSGLLMWFNTIVPTLFPFMIISYILQNVYEDSSSKPVIYCIFLGICCGTPIGAFIITNMYSLKKISRRTAYVLLTACNISSPAFVISFITKTCLKYKTINPLILFAVYFPVIIILILYSVWSEYIHPVISLNKDRPKNIFNKDRLSITSLGVPDAKNVGNMLDYTVTRSCINIIKLGGYIIISSILAEFIKSLDKINYLVRGLLIGLFEITSGISYLSQNTYNITSNITVTALILFINAFGGLSFIFQANLFIKDTDLSIIKYTFLKFAFAILTLCVFYLSIMLLKFV